MTNRAHFVERLLALGLALTCLVGCEQSTQPSQATAAPMAATAAPIAATAAEKVFVVFEGPWAFVADPKDANMVLALAPRTKAHRDLNVSASNDVNLAAGIYDLSVPSHGAPTTATLDPSFAQAKIDARSLQKAVDSKIGRYVIRIAKPEAYIPAKRSRSRFGTAYPPGPTTEQSYVTSVSLRYTVGSLNGFSLSGSPDSGTFNPFLLQLDTPAIHFSIEPAQTDDPLDNCSSHSREAFRDLVRFVSLTLYVDFPGDAPDCHGKDPQRAATARRHTLQHMIEELAASDEHRGGSNLQTLSIAEGAIYRTTLAGIAAAETIPVRSVASMILLHSSGVDCKAPMLFLTVG